MPETELKFLIAAPDLARLRSLRALRGPLERARAQKTRTTYYDTVNHDLWRLGFVLRIREAGGRLIQTVKQEQSSLIERGEWERDIEPPAGGAPPRPDLAMIEETPLAGAIGESVRAGLGAAFEVDVERTAFLWSSGETVIEIAIDRGLLRELTHGETLPISELELELKQGDSAAVYGLARTLAAQAPLQLSLISKAERGHLLRARALGLPAKASAARLGNAMTADAAFSAICGACLHDFMLNAAALDGLDAVEAVHQGRVAIRRLRAALALFRPLRRAGLERINGELSWLADVLGAARDGDVLRADGDAAAAGNVDADLLQWREARRLAAHAAVRAAVQSKRWRLFLIDLVEWIESGDRKAGRHHDQSGHGGDMVRFVRRRLRKRRDALARPACDLVRLDPDARHKLRIRAKKLRYMAQFFAGVPGIADERRLRRLLSRLDRLQSALGDLRDAEARRGVAEAEMRLWRGDSGLIEARQPGTANEDGGEKLRVAAKAYAALVRINPF